MPVVFALRWGFHNSSHHNIRDGIRAPLGTVSKDLSRQVNSLALFFVVPFILKGQDEEKQDGYSDNQKLLGVSRAYSSAPYLWKSRPPSASRQISEKFIILREPMAVHLLVYHEKSWLRRKFCDYRDPLNEMFMDMRSA